jgi:hypothetical protein
MHDESVIYLSVIRGVRQNPELARGLNCMQSITKRYVLSFAASLVVHVSLPGYCWCTVAEVQAYCTSSLASPTLSRPEVLLVFD